MKQKGDLRRIGAVFGNGLLLRNPLLVAALGMYPAAVCFSLSQALPLAILILVQSVLAAVVLCVAGNFLPGCERVMQCLHHAAPAAALKLGNPVFYALHRGF